MSIHTDQKPVTAAEFAASLAALAPSSRIAVALSGGPDSLALLFLAARWAKARKRVMLFAFTVDHGLRSESAREAHAAARMAKSLGVGHRILSWKGEKPKAGLQAAAREARYRLLAEAARAEAIGDLLVAHHLDDQAETFLLRLARGSGVDGLAAMAPARDLPGAPLLRLLRPLLSFPRARLAATLAKEKLEAIHDPSNDNLRFDRVKARRILRDLAPLGLGAERLAATAAHMARVRAALETGTQALLAAHARLAPEGFVVADARALAETPDEIALRALAEILKCVGGADYPPRFDALVAIHAALADGTLGRGRTLHGCKLSVSRGELLATREPAAALKAPPLRLRRGEAGLWDGRFVIEAEALPRAASGAEWRALGGAGLAALGSLPVLGKRGQPPAGVPKSALPALPALWRGRELLAVPHIGIVPAGLRVSVAPAGRGLLPPP